jgi:hypothetical protein
MICREAAGDDRAECDLNALRLQPPDDHFVRAGPHAALRRQHEVARALLGQPHRQCQAEATQSSGDYVRPVSPADMHTQSQWLHMITVKYY